MPPANNSNSGGNVSARTRNRMAWSTAIANTLYGRANRANSGQSNTGSVGSSRFDGFNNNNGNNTNNNTLHQQTSNEMAVDDQRNKPSYNQQQNNNNTNNYDVAAAIDVDVEDTEMIGDENKPPQVEPRAKTEYYNQLAELLRGIVLARRQYLNHADENWQNFLDKVQVAFALFFGKNPSRTYRDNFTIENYRMLFQRESSAYRDDVCRGVKRIRDGMWVNGEEVKFQPGLVDQGYQLAECGEKLMDAVFVLDDLGLHRLDCTQNTIQVIESQDKYIQKLKNAVKAFDQKYVVFEQAYIEALIAVEKQSRSLVQTIAELIEEGMKTGVLMSQELLDKMAELNKKSRDCFNCKYDNDVVEIATSRRYEASIHKRLWHLPVALLDAFDEICLYLKELLPKILRVHPKLEHNPGLVARLERFHDCYLRVENWVSCLDSSPMSRFCHFLDKVMGDKELDSSIDTILQIPRLFCLFIWENRQEVALDRDSTLTKLVLDLHPELLTDLTAALSTSTSASMEDLVRCIAVNGTDKAESDADLSLAKNLEVVSMALQRKNANSWNAFVSVILHEDESPEDKQSRPRLPSV